MKMKDITSIENVQHATKYLPTLRNMTYQERLQKLQLPTLCLRRLCDDMIELYKILSGKYDKEVCDFIPKQHNSTMSLPTRGHKMKIFVQRAEKTLRQNFLSI